MRTIDPFRPCATCPGSCAVCMGCVKPGPGALSDKYVIAFNGDQLEATRIFKALLFCCIHGYVYEFKNKIASAALL